MREAKVSIAICTKDHPQDLERCLRSLQACIEERDEVEVLVVDNASADAAAIAACAEKWGARCIREEKVGRCAARNRAIEAARGGLILYLDDDCEVSMEWLPAILHAFEDPGVAGVTGPALPAESANWAQRQVQHARSWSSTPREVGPKDLGGLFVRAVCGIGANMAFRRQALRDAGGFPAQQMAASEDDYIFWRVISAGHCIRYVPGATVYRRHRRNFVQNLWRSYEYGVSEMQMVWLLSLQARSGRLFARNCRALVLRSASAPLRSLLRGAPAIALLHTALLVGTLRGFVSPSFWRTS